MPSIPLLILVGKSALNGKWIFARAKDAREVYSGQIKAERERAFSEYTTLSEKLERDSERTQGTTETPCGPRNA